MVGYSTAKNNMLNRKIVHKIQTFNEENVKLENKTEDKTVIKTKKKREKKGQCGYF